MRSPKVIDTQIQGSNTDPGILCYYVHLHCLATVGNNGVPNSCFQQLETVSFHCCWQLSASVWVQNLRRPPECGVRCERVKKSRRNLREVAEFSKDLEDCQTAMEGKTI